MRSVHATRCTVSGEKVNVRNLQSLHLNLSMCLAISFDISMENHKNKAGVLEVASSISSYFARVWNGKTYRSSFRPNCY